MLILDFKRCKNIQVHIPLVLKATMSYMVCHLWKGPLYSQTTRMKVKKQIISLHYYGNSFGLAKPLNVSGCLIHTLRTCSIGIQGSGS